MHQDIFLRNAFVAIPNGEPGTAAGLQALASVVANLASYGYAPDAAALTRPNVEALAEGGEEFPCE